MPIGIKLDTNNYLILTAKKCQNKITSTWVMDKNTTFKFNHQITRLKSKHSTINTFKIKHNIDL